MKLSKQDFKVSIIVPIYNQEKYLDATIKALTKQTWENIEIVAVNDGSTDSSLRIIKEFMKNDSRIKLIEKENGGLVDATICGISKASGDYICFVDPDDFVGPDFISNFMENIEDYDFISMGYFENNGTNIIGHYLSEDAVFNEKQIEELQNSYLHEKHKFGISKKIYISRWNKCYKANIVKEVAVEFFKCRDVSLGEDTIFTYLFLKMCKSGKTISVPNSYVYNTNNADSMMKESDVDNYLLKVRKTFSVFEQLISGDSRCRNLPYELYYFLLYSVQNRLGKISLKDCIKFTHKLKSDDNYSKGLKLVCENRKGKINSLLWKYTNESIYCFIVYSLIPFTKHVTKKSKIIVKEGMKLVKDLTKNNVHRVIKNAQFRRDRRNAFTDLKKYMPELDIRIKPIIAEFKDQKTNLEQCAIEKNIFVFWYDGFDNAPLVVKKCLHSIEKYYQGFKIYCIDKSNYLEYTDIDELIVNDFSKGNISVQTFSDILRFNLLKNHGGIWIDSTILFLEKYDLTIGLEKKPINTINFMNSPNFFEYKGEKCSWSGFFFASRKGSVFVTAVDKVFKEYYRIYRTYSIYFFIDAVLMLCKIYGIDGNALNTIYKVDGDMFFLVNHINKKYTPAGKYFASQVPQKLTWALKTGTHDSFYDVFLSKGEK